MLRPPGMTIKSIWPPRTRPALRLGVSLALLSSVAPPPAFALGELGARSFNLYSCKATAFKDAEAPLEVPFRKMRPQGHRAEFKLLNLPDFPTLVVFLDYTYVNARR